VGPTKAPSTGAEAAATATAQAQRYVQELSQIPEIKEFGAVLKSSSVVELTEAETEYVVTLVKHVFKEHIVLQYEVKNTLPETVLENVSVVATPSEEDELEEVFILQAEKLATDEPGKVYVAFQKVNGEGSLPVSSFTNVLKFTSKEIDPTTNEPEETGYDDEYEVSEFDLTGSDYIVPTFASNFNHLWEQIGASGEEAEETLLLGGMKSIAGRFYSLCECEVKILTCFRCDGAAGKDAVSATRRWHRRPYQPEHTYPEASRQDGERWTGGSQCADGLLVEVWRDDKDYRKERGGERRSVGNWCCCLEVDKLGVEVNQMSRRVSCNLVRFMLSMMLESSWSELKVVALAPPSEVVAMRQVAPG
jgi:hypothetical protein